MVRTVVLIRSDAAILNNAISWNSDHEAGQAGEYLDSKHFAYTRFVRLRIIA